MSLEKKNTIGDGIAEMYARDREAKLTEGLRIRREEFITTNSIGNLYNRGCVVVNGVLRLRVDHGDVIMIEEDKFKSSYDCKECKGAGKIKKTCIKCEGLGHDSKDDTFCGKCDGKGTWLASCDACNGKGALVEIPKEYQKKPTSGTIVSCGPDCKIFRVGQRVCYSSYTGNSLPFNSNDRLKTMRETEVMCTLEDIDPEHPSLDQIEFSSADDPYAEANR